MPKISLFNTIKTMTYVKILIILLILIVIGFVLFNYHSTTYFSCKVELGDSKKHTDWYRVNVSVNKYLGDRYTLNQYKLSECEYYVNEDLMRRDNVYCSNYSKNEKDEEYLSFDIVNGDIEMLKDSVFGTHMKFRNIAIYNQECGKISRAVD